MDIPKSAEWSRSQAPPPSRVKTFVDLCKWQSERLGDQPSFSHLADDSVTETHLSYVQWEQRIRAIAAVLGEHGEPGDRVLIVHQPGTEYVASLFACMYAGMVAVPVYPPDLFRLRQTLPRLQAITADAEAKIMLSSRDVLGDSLGPMWSLVGDKALATEEIADGWADQFRGPSVRAGDLALLQFTSGSTGTPRGVALSHANIMANAQQGFYAFDVPDAVCVFWLPPYHDLGLIGGMLIPVYGGRRSVLMSPLAFVQQPIRWFEAIHRFRGTTTASPNFGYEWCLRKISIEQCEGLDLSSWKLAAVGAEPVRAGTLQRFAERYAAIGFSYSAFTPGYGMAEATLAVTSKPIQTIPVVRSFDTLGLHANSPVAVPRESLSETDGRSVALVSSGQPVRDCEVRIVDPVTRQLLPDGHIGEIWVSSPAVAKEYWRRPAESAATFNAQIDHSPKSGLEKESYLRTGDLGFLLDSELYVSGRLKEQIIIAGRNYFPHDIENAIQASHEAFKIDGGIAFSIDHPQGERLVIVHEVLRPKRFNLSELTTELRQTVFEETGITPHAICLVAAASLPKTSSGKLRRLECRRQYLDGELQMLCCWEAGENADHSPSPLAVERPKFEDESTLWSNTERRLAPLWCEALELKHAARAQHFLEVGGHSLGASQLLSRIRDEFKTNLTLSDLARAPRFGELATEIERRLDRPDPQGNDVETPSQLPARQMRLTQPQSRFWILDQLQRNDAFLHVGVDYVLEGPFDLDRLQSCIKLLPARHEALRVAFGTSAAGEPQQIIHEPTPLGLEYLDFSQQTESDIERKLHAMVQSNFVLEQAPLLKVALLKTSPTKHHLLIAAHHIVVDGWSMGILVQDLSQLYASGLDNGDDHATALPVWSAAISRRLTFEGQAENQQHDEYWRTRFMAAPNDCSLELSRPVAVADNLAADSNGISQVVRNRLSQTSTNKLLQSARHLGVTPFSIILTTWQEVLARYRSSSDFLFGIPVAGRNSRDEERLIGCFMDVLPFRMGAIDAEPLDQRVRTINQRLMDDISHLSVATEDILRDCLQAGGEPSFPLMQHLVLQQPALWQKVSFGDAHVADYHTDYSSLAAYDTTLVTESHDQCIELALAYAATRMDAAIAGNLLASLQSAIEQLTTCVGDGTFRQAKLQLPANDELNRIRTRLTGPVAGSTASSFMPRFAAQVAVNPDAKAIEDARSALTFSHLDQQSARIARWLSERKFGPHSRVGVLLTRSSKLPAVLLGIWKAGAAYVPLDWRLPEGRLRSIIDEAAPNGIIVDTEAGTAIDSISTACPTLDIDRILNDDSGVLDEAAFLAKNVRLAPQDAAYLMFTSGSTGRPKGVVVEHRNVANFLDSMARRPGLRAGERLLASTTVTFDISVLELFLPLVVGATCVMTPNSLSDDADAVFEFIDSRRIDVLQSTPSSLRLLLALGWQPPARLRVWVGGEALPVDLANRLLNDGVELWNMYGPTETTVWSTTGRIASTRHGQLSIGEPINGTVLRLVDRFGNDVPEGVAGELWIGGEGVARGYWNQPQLTAERFELLRAKTNTSANKSIHKSANVSNDTVRYYKTGDVARINSSRQLEVLGRMDRQIKLLGHRIELDEIETAILEHPRVREAAVTTVVSQAGDRSIVAFYTTMGDQTLAADALRTRLKQQLPEVMVPTSLVPLASLPLTPAGKIDYRVLPTDRCVVESGAAVLEFQVGQAIRAVAMPETMLQKQLAEIWQQVLNQGVVSLDDHFFRLGGHSLKAAQVIARVRANWGVAVSLKSFYANPTLRALANIIDSQSERRTTVPNTSAQPSPVLADRPAEITALVATRSEAEYAAQRDADQPLSFAEQRLWFVDRLEPNHPFYNLPLAAEVVGKLDIDLLRASFADVVARHETLRSTYRLVDGKPVREVAAHVDVVVEVQDLLSRNHSDDQVALDNLLQREARRPFDLQAAPLVRVTAIRLSEERQVILLVMHHIISDGWSMAVMLGELAQAYHARQQNSPIALPPLQTSYRQFAAEQRARMTDQAIAPSLEFWKQQLRGCTETIDLPTDFDRPPVQDFDGATFPLEISESLTSELLRLAKAYEATPFMLMLAAYGVLLSRLSGQHDFNIGTAVANRTDAELESLIGFFVGTIVLRMNTAEEPSFVDFLEQVRETTISAFEHAELPFEKLVEQIAGKRDRSHSPLFQTAIVMQNAPRDFAVASGLQLTPKHVDNGTAKYDLTLFLWEQDGRFTGYFEYRTRLFQPETIAKFARSFEELLRSITSDPRASISELSIVNDSQRKEIIKRSIGASISAQDPEVLHELFEVSVQRHAEKLAVQDGSLSWNYQQLYDQSLRIAAGLQQAGVGLETPVLHYMQRSADQIALQLGTLLAGGTFIPVDTSMPPGRVQAILSDADCKYVVVSEDNLTLAAESFPTAKLFTTQQLAASTSGDWRRLSVSKHNLAYIIYTSGSTGKPKGVLIEHSSICNFVHGFCERVQLTQDDRFLYNMSPSFDGALSQSFTALSIGASIEVVSNEILFDPSRLTQLINERNVTFAACTPSMFASLDSEQVLGMRKVLSAGEALSSEAAQPWLQSHLLYNGYGPTECTIGCAIHQIEPGFGRTPPIGVALRNMSMYVLDRKLNIVPDGVIGDVYIGGDGVGRGYLGLPELTAARFIDDPFISSCTGQAGRMYMTGDLGRWNKDGYMEILGRGDNQIKLRGFRIEPAEIAAAMEQLPEVKTAAVIAWGAAGDGGAGPRLVGYFVPESVGLAAVDALVQDAKHLEQSHIDSWRKLFDQSHQHAGLVLTPEDDFSGWQSVISGQLIPLHLMREWADQSAARIRKLSPRRLLEMGCGTGLIMLRLTDAFQQYQGIDVLPSSIEQLKRTVLGREELQGRVEACVGFADQLHDLPAGTFDTIVLNSVVQYFPSVEYLMKVLQGAVERLSFGGKIYLGDVRDLRLHGAFATEVELARAADESLTVSKLRRRIMSRMEHDEELLLEPSMFRHLSNYLPRLKNFELLYKVGDDANELNRYRFDVILHFDTFESPVEPQSMALPEPQYERDGRLRREWLLWDLLRQVDGSRSVDDVIQQVEDLLDRHENWGALQQAASDLQIAISVTTDQSESHRLETWGNNPLQRRKSLELVTRMRDRLRERLPEYMVPSAFVAMERLPLTVQGKLDKAALPPPPAARPEWAGGWKSPRDEFESLLVEIWEDLLEVDPVGIEDDFFELGGHSMLAVRMMAEVERRTGTVLPLAALFQKATIDHLANLLRKPDAVSPLSAIVTLAKASSGAPLFCIHPAGGTVFCYRPLADLLQGSRPVYGVQARGVDGHGEPHQALDEMAGYYADAIIQIESQGPYHLVGWSLGGNIAYEVAQKLSAMGHTIGSLTLLDSGLISESEPLKEADFLPMIAALFPDGHHLPLEQLREKSPQEQLDYFVQRAAKAGIVPTDAGALGTQIFQVFQANIKAVHNHQTTKFAGSIRLVRPADQMRTGSLFDDPTLGWREWVSDVTVIEVPGDHASMLRSPAVEQVAELLKH